MTIDILTIAAVVAAFFIGLLIGYFAFSGRKARTALQEKVAERDAQLVAGRERVAALEQDLAMARDQIAPLADEVDRLKAMKTRVPPKEERIEGAAAPVPSERRVTSFQSSESVPAFLSERPENPDDLSLMKGVGPKLEDTLHEMGIWYFAQIANWSDDDRQTIDAKMGNFRGRIEKDRLQEQAKLLAAGRITEYEARFGKLGGVAP